MRKLALLLGSLVVVASASAKEVVPAPVVVEEAPVQIVEKEVIVYRDKEEGFRPNGNIGLEYRAFGETEGQDCGDWSSSDGDNYGRVQLSGAINMTEKQRLEFRVRNWNSLDQENKLKTRKNGNETRLRYFYNHGNLGDSKVNLTSRVEYKDTSKQKLHYQARFDFAEYLFNNDFVKTQYFQIQPGYTYEWKDGNDSQYDSQVNLDLETMFSLPLGFNFEFNVYNTLHNYGSKDYYDGKATYIEEPSDNYTVDVEAKIYKSVELYATEKTTLSLTFEGGYDDYSWSREDLVQKDHNFTYSVYANPFLRVDHQATEFVSLFAEVGAEYRNWAESNQCAAQDWRWQPVAAAGFNVAF